MTSGEVGRYDQYSSYRMLSEPGTSIQIGHGLVVAAFSTGHLRIYSLSKQSLIVEIAAHARSISAIDIHPKEPLVCYMLHDVDEMCKS